MWSYERRLQYPVNIKQTNPKLAMVIMSQFGGPDGELAASMRYLSQRYAMPYREVAGLLTDIGTGDSLVPHRVRGSLKPLILAGFGDCLCFVGMLFKKPLGHKCHFR